MSTKKIQILNGASIIPKPDWNQTDDTKADYIKNRPFYEDTLVNITWDGDTIGKTKVDLTSVLGFNVYLVSDYAPSVEDLTGSTVTVYDGSSSMEFSVRSVQTPSDNIIIVLDGYAFVILKDNSEFNGIVFPSKGTYFANGGESYVSRITKKVISQIDPKFINMDSFPKELLKITVTSSDSTYSADKTDSDIKSCLDNGGIPYIALYDTVFIYEGYSSDIGYMFIDTNDGKMLCIYNNSVSLYSSNLKSKLDSIVSTTAQTLTDEQKTQARTNIGATDISFGLTGSSAGQIIKIKSVDESGVPTEWTSTNMPSGGGADISLGISGASAGQMAKIKTVNESGAPTAWEAGDAASGGGASEWTLFQEGITDADVSGFEFDGVGDYTEFLFLGSWVKGSGKAGLSVKMNDAYALTVGNYFVHDVQAKNVSVELILMERKRFSLRGLSQQQNSTQYNIDELGTQSIYNIPQGIETPITKISFYSSNTNVQIPAGATYALYVR